MDTPLEEVDVQVLRRRLIEARGGSEHVGADLSRAAVEFTRARAGVAAVEPDLAISGDDVSVGIEFLSNINRRRLGIGAWRG